jgi:isoleucyl-tRNA synthetase
LLRLIAPILSFTAEEAWQVLASESHRASGTIFGEKYYPLPDVGNGGDLRAKWEDIREVRSSVLKVLEEMRAAKKIGSSLQAEVEIKANGAQLSQLQSLEDDARFVFITSQARVAKGNGELAVAALASPHPKCARCWHWRADVGVDANHPEICGRCVSNLFGSGEPRRFA